MNILYKAALVQIQAQMKTQRNSMCNNLALMNKSISMYIRMKSNNRTILG